MNILNVLGWVGVVLLGLAHGLLEDIVFVSILVPYMPASWDLTGDLFFVFTFPLAQLMAFAVTGTIGWFLLGLKQPARLLTFWLLWTGARVTFLVFAKNPWPDILVYVLWIAFWCALYGLLARLLAPAQGGATTAS